MRGLVEKGVRKLPEWISIGYITKAHGVKGEVRFTPISKDPSRIKNFKSVKIESPAGVISFLEIEKVRVNRDCAFITFKGIDSRDQALALKGISIQIRRTDCQPLSADEYYYFDLIGLIVKTTEGERLGEIVDIMEMPANDVYVLSDGNREVLIPAIGDVVKKVDLEKEEIIIEVIDGLL